jgi:hypothetical protein
MPPPKAAVRQALRRRITAPWGRPRLDSASRMLLRERAEYPPPPGEDVQGKNSWLCFPFRIENGEAIQRALRLLNACQADMRVARQPVVSNNSVGGKRSRAGWRNCTIPSTRSASMRRN